MTAKKIAIYTQDGRNRGDSADHQMDWITELTTGEEVEIPREYVDYRNMALYRMLEEGTQEHPTFDEIIVTDLGLLGDTKKEIKARLKEVKRKGVAVRDVGRLKEKPEAARTENAITDRAREILSEGTKDNPEGENTVVISELDGEATISRIFRRRHTGGDPREAADRWIRHVKECCTSAYEELEARARGSKLDGESVTVAITGKGIVAREEIESEERQSGIAFCVQDTGNPEYTVFDLNLEIKL